MRRKDRELWDAIRATVTPLRRGEALPPVPASAPSPPAPVEPHRHAPPPRARRPHAPPPASGPAANSLDRRTRQRLLRGKAEIEGRLDLHGDSAEVAYVHGEAHWHAPEREGRLRRVLPQWLEEPELKALVVAYQPAHPRHGGGGAWYLRLRRKP